MIYVLLHCCIVQPTITITTYKKWQLHNDSLLFSHVCYWMAFTPVKAPSTPLSWNLQFPCLKQMHFTWKERNIQCLKKKQQQPKKEEAHQPFGLGIFCNGIFLLRNILLAVSKNFRRWKDYFWGAFGLGRLIIDAHRLWWAVGAGKERRSKRFWLWEWEWWKPRTGIQQPAG